MPPAFLIGGGRDPEGVRASHEPFARACLGGPIAVLMLDEGEGADEARWLDSLADAGAQQLVPVVIGEDRALDPEPFEGITGAFVCGGLTPLYRTLLVDRFPQWLPEGTIYGGYSAGAAIAATRAIVGGWRIQRGDREVPVCPENAGEDLDDVAVVRGLGLVDFSVDVHASQWGTLGRLAQAVAAGLTPEGIAIDEHTCVEVGPDRPLTVHGLGSAYRVHRIDGGDVAVEILP